MQPTTTDNAPRRYGRFSLEPYAASRVETPHRRIVTPIPVPESIPVFDRLLRHEPPSMGGQPPILWDHAERASVHDRFGNQWIDWSSCVLVSNAGHSHPRVLERVRRLVERGQLATYVFAHEERAELVEKLTEIAPPGLGRAFLLTTGSEAVECAIKLMRTWGRKRDPEKRVIVSFRGGFHGRTLGAQLAGGIPALKDWIGADDPSFVQVPFPDGYLQRDVSFARFEEGLSRAGVPPDRVAGVLSETYLGIGPDFFPAEYARGAPGVVRSPRRPPHLRRGPGGLRADREAVRLRALRRGPGPASPAGRGSRARYRWRR